MMMSGNKLFSVKYLETVIQDDLPALSLSARKIIKKAIEERLMVDLVKFGKPLRYSLKGHLRLRVSNYRIVYRIDDSCKSVIIIAIKHRKDIYEE